jgi:predicted GIY-YIG superfamily endonuclease
MTRQRFITRHQPFGVVYMLHFSEPYKHARHYVGWTEDLLCRLDQHASGHGARLVAVIWQAGIGFTLIRICEGTRSTERAIKNNGGAPRFCPACTSRPWNGPWQAMPAGFIPRTYANPAGRR